MFIIGLFILICKRKILSSFFLIFVEKTTVNHQPIQYQIFANGAKNSRTAKVAIECALQLRNKTLLRKTQPRNRQAELTYLMNINNRLLHAPGVSVGIAVVERRLEKSVLSLRARLIPGTRIAAKLHNPEFELLLVPVYGT